MRSYLSTCLSGMTLLILLSVAPAGAQETLHFRLLDETSGASIDGCAYRYGAKSGLSDEQGLIRFVLEGDSVMSLSHLSYGAWQMTPEDLREAVRKGVAFRQRAEVNLYPVTVIAVKATRDGAERMDLEFQDRLAHDGGALLLRTPAISAIRKGGSYGFDPVFRGFKYDQVNVVLNGAQCATAACPNRMDPPTSQMAPNMIDRIELLKGPYALRYGTGFGATVNFVPEELRFTAERDLYGRITGGYDHNGQNIRSEGMVGLAGVAYDVRLFGGWAGGDDYTDGDGGTVQADYTRSSLGAQAGFKAGKRQQFRVSAVRNAARDVDFAALGMDLRSDDTWLLNARHDIRIDGRTLDTWNTTVYGSFVDHVMDNLTKPLNPRMMNMVTDADTRNYGFRTEGVWQFGSASLFAGADWRHEGADGTRSREFLMGPNAGKTVYDNVWQDSRISRSSVFAEYHLIRGTYHFVMSGRVEYNTGDAGNPDPAFLETYGELSVSDVNPNISIGAIRKLDDDLSLSLWLGRAQRSGGLTERYINYFPVGQDAYEMLGDPGIKPEVNNQADLSLDWQRPTMAFKIDVFAAFMQDFISSVIDTSLTPRMPTSPGVRRYVNVDEAFKAGIEVSWTQSLFWGLQHQLGLAYTYAQDLQRDQPLPEIAPLDLRYSLSGTYVKGRLTPGISLRHVVQQDRVSPEFGESVTPAFTLLDIRAGYAVTSSIQLALGVTNLFDVRYYEHLNRPINMNGMKTPLYAPGRNAYATFSVAF